MKKPEQNETLYAAAVRLENDRHNHRLKQLKTFKNRLDALTPYMPDLKAAGIEIWAAEITFSAKAMTLMPGFFNSQRVCKAIEVLSKHAFKQTARDERGSYEHIVMSKGHVHLYFDLDKPRTPAQAAA